MDLPMGEDPQMRFAHGEGWIRDRRAPKSRLRQESFCVRVAVADVGWGLWEELNTFDAGDGVVRNFGWPCFEGPARQPVVTDAQIPLCQSLSVDDVTPPTFAYSHSDSLGSGCSTGGTSITGVASLRGGPYPAPFNDGVFTVDYSRQCIWFVPRSGSGYDFANRRSLLTSAPVVDLQIGPDGYLYFADVIGGAIRRLLPTGSNRAPTAVLAADPSGGHPPLTIELSAAGSTDPDGDALTYAWDLDDDGVFDDATGRDVEVDYTEVGTHRVSVRVTDSHGAFDIASRTLVIGNDAPTATIELPLVGVYSPGTQLQFSGTGTDPEDGTLPPSAFTWHFTIQHCNTPDSCHEHPIGAIDGVSSGVFEMPQHERPSFVDVELTVVDSHGESNSVVRRIEVGD